MITLKRFRKMLDLHQEDKLERMLPPEKRKRFRKMLSQAFVDKIWHNLFSVEDEVSDTSDEDEVSEATDEVEVRDAVDEDKWPDYGDEDEDRE